MQGIVQFSDQNYQFARHILLTDTDRFAELLNDKAICAYRVAPDGKIISASPALINLLGYKSFEELYAAELEKTEFDTIYAEAIFAQYDGKVLDTETEWRCADGSTIKMRESARATYDVSGHPWHYDGVLIPTDHPASQPDEHDEDQHSAWPVAAPAIHMPRRDAMPVTVKKLNELPRAQGELALQQYISILWRWMWLVIVCSIISGVAAAIVSSRMTPVFQSATTLLIEQSGNLSSASQNYDALLASQILAKSYTDLLTKRPVLSEVIANLKLDTSIEQLAARTTTSNIADSQLVVVTVEDTNAQRAADIANELVRVFSEQVSAQQKAKYEANRLDLLKEMSQVENDIKNTQAQIDTLTPTTNTDQSDQKQSLETLISEYRNNYTVLLNSLTTLRLADPTDKNSIKVVEEAHANLAQVSPRILLNSGVALLAAAILTLFLVFLMEWFDTSISSPKFFRQLAALPIAAKLPKIKGLSSQSQLYTAHNSTEMPEVFRMLRASINLATRETSSFSLAVTSVEANAGKSLFAANIGISMARSGKKVIIVDTSTDNPRMHTIFGCTNAAGLTNVLSKRDTAKLDEYLLETNIENLLLLPSGPALDTGADLIASVYMEEVLQALKQHSQIVILDTPHLGLGDGLSIVSLCDEVLLVVQDGLTKMNAVRQVEKQLQALEIPVFGVAINRFRNRKFRY